MLLHVQEKSTRHNKHNLQGGRREERGRDDGLQKTGSDWYLHHRSRVHFSQRHPRMPCMASTFEMT